MRLYKLLFTVLFLFNSFTSTAKDILTYEENVVLCESVLELFSGELTFGLIQKFSNKYGFESTKEFLEENSKENILCSGRPLIYFTIDRGHDDDVKALIDSGLDPNNLIEDKNGRRMTMLDYAMITYKAADNPNKKETIKAKIKVIRRAGGRTCSHLQFNNCIFTL